MSETRRPSTTQRLAELRSAQPCDTTLQNLLSILNAKLDLSARLPVFEYEADSEGFQEAASFMSALASAERESVHDVLRSLRMHLDTHERTLRLVLGGLLMISVALIADSGPALEAMTSSLASVPGVTIVRHCHGHAAHRRRPHALRSRPRSCSTRCIGRGSRSSASTRSASVLPQARVVVRAARPDAGWLADALRAGASAVVPATAGPETLGRGAAGSVAERGASPTRPDWRPDER